MIKQNKKKAAYKPERTSVNLYAALKSGSLKYQRKPGLIKVVQLEKYLKHCQNLTRLLEAIAFALVFDHSQKTSEIYQVAFNSMPLTKEEWKHHCPLFLKKDKMAENPTTLEEIIIIDFSILQKEQEKNNLFQEYPYLKQSLISEISRLWNTL